MRALPEDLPEASWLSMAMTTKTELALLGVVALLVAAFTLWYFTMEKWAAKYQQTNAAWRIHGVCTNAQDGTPVKGAEITASFCEPVTSKHKWRNLPIRTTSVVTRTDDQGRFVLIGEGGHVQIKVRAEGYREPESWEDWRHSAMNGVKQVDTNVALSLQPASKPTREAK
jgi:hypothetical protein